MDTKDFFASSSYSHQPELLLPYPELKLSDIWGRKPIVLAAIALFFLSSIICATSVSMGVLIAGRAVQGAAAGGLILLANICVIDLFDMRSVPIKVWKARD